MDYQLDYYKLPNGSSPVQEFLDGMNPKLLAKTLRALQLLQEYGSLLREPDSKHIRKGIFELRVTFSRHNVRILYFFFSNSTIVATNGFEKKTNKIPRREFDRAMKFRRDYERRANDI